MPQDSARGQNVDLDTTRQENLAFYLTSLQSEYIIDRSDWLKKIENVHNRYSIVFSTNRRDVVKRLQPEPLVSRC